MLVLSRKSVLWSYVEPDVRGLIADGEILLDHAESYKGRISDFSYLVFPFSKAYEGFLKKFFLDLGLMREDEYFSSELRIGRVLNPKYMDEHAHLYKAMCLHKKGGNDLASLLWNVWRKGRNQVFHYFPNNFRSLSLNEALEIIHQVVDAMSQAVTKCDIE
jgi:hypothetical protein